jgi:hypothetical protein
MVPMSTVLMMDNFHVYVIVAMLASLGSSLLTHRWNLKHRQNKEKIIEQRNRNIRKTIYFELRFYLEQFERLHSKENCSHKITINLDSEEARILNNLADPTRIRYKKIGLESLVEAFQEEEILNELKHSYDAIGSFFEKYPFQLKRIEKGSTAPDVRSIDIEDIVLMRLRVTSGLEKIERFVKENV